MPARRHAAPLHLLPQAEALPHAAAFSALAPTLRAAGSTSAFHPGCILPSRAPDIAFPGPDAHPRPPTHTTLPPQGCLVWNSATTTEVFELLHGGCQLIFVYANTLLEGISAPDADPWPDYTTAELLAVPEGFSAAQVRQAEGVQGTRVWGYGCVPGASSGRHPWLGRPPHQPAAAGAST